MNQAEAFRQGGARGTRDAIIAPSKRSDKPGKVAWSDRAYSDDDVDQPADTVQQQPQALLAYAMGARSRAAERQADAEMHAQFAEAARAAAERARQRLLDRQPLALRWTG
ncbi:hypothetical protein ACQP2F_45630 [Actinoplanes sp. CA-030573]|uniref:hypothetical protein n=1 Tax=Actinoplanes sp. CA-030573 TaxID=3239898 RepID=UPI003D8CF42B